MIKQFIFCSLCLILLWQNSFPQRLKGSLNSSNTAQLYKWYAYVEDFMDAEQYDSAQYWLVKINDLINDLPNSYFRYLLHSRQSEVYYYNNLSQLGLAECKRAAAIAQEIKDNILLADALNFNGLFYMQIDSLDQAIQCFRQSLAVLPPPPYDSSHTNFSYPYHVHGNMSEAYFKKSNFDSALVHAGWSFEKARQVDRPRGMAIAWQTMGDIHRMKNERGGAVHYLQQAFGTAANWGDYDVSLLCAGSLALCYATANFGDSSRHWLNTGISLVKKYPNLNRFFTGQFLNQAYKVYSTLGDAGMTISTLKQLTEIQQQSLLVYNTQLESIVNASIQNEQRLRALEVTDALSSKQLANSRLLIVLFLLIIIVVSFFIYFNRQKARQHLNELRNKISRDLHDDIGASLSSLNIYSAIAGASLPANIPKAGEMLNRISNETKSILENMDDIVWSMPSTTQSHVSFENRIKNYGTNLLAEKDIAVAYHIDQKLNTEIENFVARRNIWLICKEAMNNMAKYSQATNGIISMKIIHQHLTLLIEDNGIGYDPEKIRSGNGIGNMLKRAEELKGEFVISSSQGSGTKIRVSVPVNSLK